jgi:copper ion binding protein
MVTTRFDPVREESSMSVSAAHSATFAVAGMTCEHCVASVTEELGTISGVTGVTVDLAAGSVVVTSARELGKDEVASAINEAGYQLTG